MSEEREDLLAALVLAAQNDVSHIFSLRHEHTADLRLQSISPLIFFSTCIPIPLVAACCPISALLLSAGTLLVVILLPGERSMLLSNRAVRQVIMDGETSRFSACYSSRNASRLAYVAFSGQWRHPSHVEADQHESDEWALGQSPAKSSSPEYYASPKRRQAPLDRSKSTLQPERTEDVKPSIRGLHHLQGQVNIIMKTCQIPNGGRLLSIVKPAQVHLSHQDDLLHRLAGLQMLSYLPINRYYQRAR